MDSELRYNLKSRSEEEEIITGKPYPEDFGTSVEKVYKYVKARDAISNKEYPMWQRILWTFLGAFAIGLIMELIYSDIYITLFFAVISGCVAYYCGREFFFKIKEYQLLKMDANSAEGVYLTALRTWLENEYKKAQKALLDEEKEYLENPWTIHSKGPLVQLFPQLSSATIIRNDSAPENTPDGYLMKGITTSGDEIVLTLWFGKDNRTSTASMMSSSIHISLKSRGSKVYLHSAQCIDASRNGIRKTFLVWQFENLRF